MTMTTESHITALVLAAGLSTRMGPSNKLLLDIDGKAMLAVVLDRILGSSVNELILVLGHEADKIREKVSLDDPRVHIVLNNDYQAGMSTSISTGIKSIRSTTVACMICLADMPFIDSWTYEKLLVEFRTQGSADQILIPRFKDKVGNPIVFGRNYFSALKKLPPKDRGAKQIIEKHPSRQIFIELECDQILRDIDHLNN